MRHKWVCQLLNLSCLYFVTILFIWKTRWDAASCNACNVWRECVSCGPTLLFLLTERELVTRSRGKATLWQTHPPVGARKSSSSSSAPNMFLSFTLFFWKSKSPQTVGQICCMSSLLKQNFPFSYLERQSGDIQSADAGFHSISGPSRQQSVVNSQSIGCLNAKWYICRVCRYICDRSTEFQINNSG